MARNITYILYHAHRPSDVHKLVGGARGDGKECPGCLYEDESGIDAFGQNEPTLRMHRESEKPVKATQKLCHSVLAFCEEGPEHLSGEEG